MSAWDQEQSARRGPERAIAVIVLSLVALAGVGCNEPPSSIDVGSNGAIDAGVDAGTRDAGSDAGPGLHGFSLGPWGPCPGVSAPTTQIDCATLTVPIDWSNPAGPMLTRPVRRYHASGDRIGVLLWNPGGPGGVTYPYPDVLSTAATAARFDRISVDWRGVGSSRPVLSCPRPAALSVLRNVTAAGWLPGAVEASIHYGREAMTECLTALDPLLVTHVGTADMARDMEALRIALGETQINYVGFSYGTALGATYASLYPDRVRAFVLDSPVAPGLDWLTFGEEQIAAQEAGLRAFFEWCAASPARCPFAAGRDAAALLEAFVAVDQELARRPRAITDTRGEEHVLDASGFLDYAVASIRDPDAWPAFGSELAAAEAGDPSGPAAWATAGDTTDTWSVSLWLVHGCDRAFDAWVTDTYLIERSRGMVAAFPVLGSRLLGADGSFLALPRMRAAPDIHAPTAPPLLIIANRGDMQTPYAWAPGMRDALGNGSHLVTYEGLGHARSADVECLSTVANAFLLDPVSAPRTTTCAAVAP